MPRGNWGLGAAPELGATTETLTSPNSFRGRVPPPFLLQWRPLAFSGASRPVCLFSDRNTSTSREIRDPAAASAANSGQIGSNSSKTQGSGEAGGPVRERQCQSHET